MRKQLHLFDTAEKLKWTIAIGVAIGVFVGSLFLPGGGDFYKNFLPFAQGCLTCGYLPYYAQWFLWPLSLLPPFPYAWPLFIVFSVTIYFILVRQTKINPALFMIAIPLLSQLWDGQIDVYIALGFVILLFGKSPYLRGLGVMLALIKPQLSFIALFYMFLLEDWRDVWKVLLIPALTGILSLIVFGLEWPFEWIEKALLLPIHRGRTATLDIWRFGVFFVWIPFLYKDRTKRLYSSLVVSSIASPFFSIYSYVIFVLFYCPWWVIILSSVWMLMIPFIGDEAYRFAWILPVALIIKLLYGYWRVHRFGLENQEENN